MLSIGAQIKKIAGLVGTDDVDERTADFIVSVCDKTQEGRNTTGLTEKQIDWVGDIHKKHFGPIT